MSGNWLKYAAFGAIFLAIVLGLVAYRWTARLTAQKTQAEQVEEARQELPSTLAVVALRPLAANRPIGSDDVALKPVSIVPANYFADVNDAIGRIPQIDIDTGAPVTPRYFRMANLLARIIPAGHQAMSLEISDVVAVGGFVRPGDLVDLLLYVRGPEMPPQSRILLPAVRVLAYEERIIDRPEGLTEESAPSQRRSRVRTAVVAVPEAETTKIMLGASLGDIRLALRRSADLDDERQSLELAPAEALDPLAAARIITFDELTRLQPAKPKSDKPAAHVIYVYKGSTVKRVTD